MLSSNLICSWTTPWPCSMSVNFPIHVDKIAHSCYYHDRRQLNSHLATQHKLDLLLEGRIRDGRTSDESQYESSH
jgi:hypothetical protein